MKMHDKALDIFFSDWLRRYQSDGRENIVKPRMTEFVIE